MTYSVFLSQNLAGVTVEIYEKVESVWTVSKQGFGPGISRVLTSNAITSTAIF
jgi:hypothetical protein